MNSSKALLLIIVIIIIVLCAGVWLLGQTPAAKPAARATRTAGPDLSGGAIPGATLVGGVAVVVVTATPPDPTATPTRPTRTPTPCGNNQLVTGSGTVYLPPKAVAEKTESGREVRRVADGVEVDSVEWAYPCPWTASVPKTGTHYLWPVGVWVSNGVLTYRPVTLAAGGEMRFGEVVTLAVTTNLQHIAAAEPIRIERWGNFPYIAVSWLAVQEKEGKIIILLEELRYLTDNWTAPGQLPQLAPVPPPKKLPMPAATTAPGKTATPAVRR